MTLLSVVLKKSEIVIKKKVAMTTVFFLKNDGHRRLNIEISLKSYLN